MLALAVFSHFLSYAYTEPLAVGYSSTLGPAWPCTWPQLWWWRQAEAAFHSPGLRATTQAPPVQVKSPVQVPHPAPSDVSLLQARALVPRLFQLTKKFLCDCEEQQRDRGLRCQSGLLAGIVEENFGAVLMYWSGSSTQGQGTCEASLT